MRQILSCVFFAIMTSAPLAHAQLSALQQSSALTFLGHDAQKTGDFHTATGYYEKAIAILDRDGPHPIEYAITLSAMATLYAESGQPDTAKRLLLRSVPMFESDSNHHGELAIVWKDLATIAADQRSSREAHKYMARSLAESQLVTSLSSDLTSALLTTQARIAEIEGNPRTAIADYQQALALSKQSHNDQYPETAWLYVLLGGAYLQANDLAPAREMTSRGLNLLESISSRQSPRYLAAELAYSRVLDASGSHNEASTLRNEALAAMATWSKRTQGEISISALR